MKDIHLALMLRCQCPSVCLSVCLSVTEVHWRIIANLGCKFWSQFTVHCGRGACRPVMRERAWTNVKSFISITSRTQWVVEICCRFSTNATQQNYTSTGKRVLDERTWSPDEQSASSLCISCQLTQIIRQLHVTEIAVFSALYCLIIGLTCTVLVFVQHNFWAFHVG